jgi:hypothetical protein
MEHTQREELYKTIVEKAWEDADFKRELTENPLDAIERVTGVRLNLPEGKRIVVRDQSDVNTVYVNIPPVDTKDDVELNEEELELVSGGKSLPFIDIFVPTFPPIGIYPIEPIGPIKPIIKS